MVTERRISDMTESEFIQLLRRIIREEQAQVPKLKLAASPEHYNPLEDKTMGFMPGPTDFGERAEEILENKYNRQS
jgi:hypothetical protein